MRFGRREAPNRGSVRRRVTTVAGAVTAGAVALVLSGCAPTHTYLTSSSAQTFLAVPPSWKVLHDKALDVTPEAAAAGAYTAFFDHNAKPAFPYDYKRPTAQPWGVVVAQPLSADEQQEVNLDLLGNFLVNVDGLSQKHQAAVLSQTVLHHGIYRGTREEIAFDGKSGMPVEAELESYTDSATDRVWTMMVGCSPDCFQTNKGQINQVVDSWIIGTAKNSSQS